MFSRVKHFLSPTEIESRRTEQIEGVGAETVLRALGPVMERRLESLLLALIKAPPDFDTLLDLRAQLAEVYRIQAELKAIKANGKEAGEALGEIFQAT